MVNYELGKIYKIVCNTTNQCYVGSTCNPLLSTRLAGHRGCYKSFKEKRKGDNMTSYKVLENDNYEIILIEKFPCKDKMELHQRERYWIENTECVNKCVPLRIDGESYEYQQLYRVSHKNKAVEYAKTYREINKAQLKEKYNKPQTCDCGGKYIRCCKARHIRTDRHQTFINSQRNINE